MRRATSTIIVVVLMGCLGAGSAARGADEGACHLVGLARFAPSLSLTESVSAITLHGELRDCVVAPGAAATATVSIGNSWSEPSSAAGGDTWLWQEPAGTISGTCLHSEIVALGLVRWADGTNTVIELTAQTGTYGIPVSARVIPSAQLTAIDAKPGQPATRTVTTDRLEGGAVAGLLVANPPDMGVSCGTGGLPETPLEGAVTAVSP